MTAYVMRNGKLVEKHLAGPKNGGAAPAFGVIRDEMDATRHMADGKMYTSKAKFRQATRDAGCVEVGNETSTLLKQRAPVQLDRGARREHIRQAISELKRQR